MNRFLQKLKEKKTPGQWVKFLLYHVWGVGSVVLGIMSLFSLVVASCEFLLCVITAPAAFFFLPFGVVYILSLFKNITRSQYFSWLIKLFIAEVIIVVLLLIGGIIYWVQQGSVE